jgi:hypothetical protein
MQLRGVISFVVSVLALGLPAHLSAQEEYTWSSGFSSHSGSGKECLGYCDAALMLTQKDLRPLVMFGLNKRPNEKGRYVYFLLFKTPEKVAGALEEEFKGSGDNDKADTTFSVVLAKKRIKIAYKLEAHKKTHALVKESLKIGDQEVKEGAPRVFLVDLTRDTISYQPVKVDLPDDVPDLADSDHKTWGATVRRAIDKLKKGSPEVKKFLEASPIKETKALGDDFVYPGAEKLVTAASPAWEGPGIFSAKYTATDGSGKVVAWYRKKLGIQAGEGIKINPGNEPGIRASLLDDSRQPKEPGQAIGEPRPVSLVAFLKKTNALIVNAVISRAKDEKVTHIVLTVVDNKDQ